MLVGVLLPHPWACPAAAKGLARGSVVVGETKDAATVASRLDLADHRADRLVEGIPVDAATAGAWHDVLVFSRVPHAAIGAQAYTGRRQYVLERDLGARVVRVQRLKLVEGVLAVDRRIRREIIHDGHASS